ncbi:MAG: glycerophosphodiester phosphodiesterase [bacterium]|nr:glycerophosphodiester phosphodiesterase [Betaproteobacteria bacterium]
MLVFAHRGHHVVFPQNTLQAFDAALRIGADGIETDVRLSRDGVPVLFHDEQVRGRPIAELTRHDIARIAGHEVPTLNEALLRFPKPIWNIEVKAPAAVGAVLQAMSAFATTRRMIVTSFHHDLVVRCARVAAVPSGLLLSHAPSDLPGMLAAHAESPWVRTLVWDQRVLTPTLLRQARAARWWNFVYGVDDPDSMRLLAKHGVDAVITDRADLVPAELRRAPVPAARMPQPAGAADTADTAEPAGTADALVYRTDAAAMLRESIAAWSDEL